MSTPAGKPGDAVKAVEKAGGMGIGKGLLVAAGATAALYALSQIMKKPDPPRRHTRGAGNDAPDDLIFTGYNTGVGVGAVSMPIPGQQQQMGSWSARVQPADPSQQPPSVPTR